MAKILTDAIIPELKGKHSGVTPEVLQFFGDVTSSSVITVEHNGFLRGLCRVDSNQSADVLIGEYPIGGVTYVSPSTPGGVEIPFCIPVNAGTEVTVRAINGGRVVNLMLLAPLHN